MGEPWDPKEAARKDAAEVVAKHSEAIRDAVKPQPDWRAIAGEQGPAMERLLQAYKSAKTSIHQEFGDSPADASHRVNQEQLVKDCEAALARYREAEKEMSGG